MKSKKYLFEALRLKDKERYWFRRKYVDMRLGKSRSVLVMIERIENGEPINKSGEWRLQVEDRKSMQTWKLNLRRLDGVEKLVFERTVRRSTGVKSDILSMAYTPVWVKKTLKIVKCELEMRHWNVAAVSFLQKLIGAINKESKEKIGTSTARLRKTGVSGLYHILSVTRGDERGSFREVVRVPEVELLTGYDFLGKQINHSFSAYGTLRGLHVEPWAKLVTVVSGLVVCALLDCRPKSITFGKYKMIHLGYGKTKNGDVVSGGALFIEPGIANSYMVLSEKCDYAYVVDDIWTPQTSTFAVNPMDESLAIPWSDYIPKDKIIRSERDKTSPKFADFCKQIQ